jgi:hypothetical protein
MSGQGVFMSLLNVRSFAARGRITHAPPNISGKSAIRSLGWSTPHDILLIIVEQENPNQLS